MHQNMIVIKATEAASHSFASLYALWKNVPSERREISVRYAAASLFFRYLSRPFEISAFAPVSKSNIFHPVFCYPGYVSVSVFSKIYHTFETKLVPIPRSKVEGSRSARSDSFCYL